MERFAEPNPVGVCTGLVDEMLIHLTPVLRGDGVRLFARLNAAPVEMETMAVSQAGQITNLRFRIVK